MWILRRKNRILRIRHREWKSGHAKTEGLRNSWLATTRKRITSQKLLRLLQLVSKVHRSLRQPLQAAQQPVTQKCPLGLDPWSTCRFWKAQSRFHLKTCALNSWLYKTFHHWSRHFFIRDRGRFTPRRFQRRWTPLRIHLTLSRPRRKELLSLWLRIICNHSSTTRMTTLRTGKLLGNSRTNGSRKSDLL